MWFLYCEYSSYSAKAIRHPPRKGAWKSWWVAALYKYLILNFKGAAFFWGTSTLRTGFCSFTERSWERAEMKKETSGGCSAEVRVKGWVFLAVLFAFFFPLLSSDLPI